MGEGQDKRLNGWKAIAAYLGREERTARRWEAERGLPVHRVPGGGSGTVWADSQELADWLGDRQGQAAQEQETPRERRWLWPSVAAATLALAGLTAWAPWTDPSPTQAAAPYGKDAKANAAFATANLAMERRTVPGLLKAETLFAQLTQSHPKNAAGYVGLADTYLLLREFNSLPPETAFRRATIAADKALAIDPKSHRALRAKAFITYWSEGERAEGLRLIDQAIKLAPQDATAQHWRGTMLMGEPGRARDALSALTEANRLNPDSSTIAADRAYGLYLAGQKVEAKAALADIAQIDPDFNNTHAYLERIRLLEGDYPGFLASAERTARLRLQDARLETVLAAKTAYASGGREAMFATLIAAEEKRFEQDGESALRLAILHAAKGDREGVRRWLLKAREIKEPGSEALPAFIEFVGFQGDPAFYGLFGR